METLKLNKMTIDDQATTINMNYIILCRDARLGGGYGVKHTSISRQYNVFINARMH